MTDQRGLRYVALDFGAESGRTIVGRFDGDLLSIEPVHRYPNTPVRMGGTLFWDFPRQFGDILGGLERAAVDGPVASVAVDTWGVDYGFIDARGRLLANPVHYRDTRHEKMPEVAFEMVPRAEIYAATGIQFMSINTLFQLLSEVRAGDPLLRQADRLLMMPDLFNHFLCGSVVAEYTEATTSQCLDPWTRDWARPLFDRLGIPTDFLPEVVAPGTVLGELLPGVAEQTGLTGTQGRGGGRARHRIGRGRHPAGRSIDRLHLVGHLVAGRPGGHGSRSWTSVRWPPTSPTRAATAARSRCSRTSWASGSCSSAAAHCGARTSAPPTRSSRPWPAAGPSGTAFVDPTDGRFLWPGDIPTRVREFCAETGQPVPQDTPTLLRVILESLALRYAVVFDELETVTGPAHRADPHRGRRRQQHAALPADRGRQRPTGGGRARGGHGHRQHRHPGHRHRASCADIGQARELIARSFPTVIYEPRGDWSEARARYAAMQASRSQA